MMPELVQRYPRVLALDPGLSVVGYAVIILGELKDQVARVGTIRTSPSNKRLRVRQADDDMRRCKEIARELATLVRQDGVRGVLSELPGGQSQSARAASAMGMSKAIVASVVEVLRLPVEYYTPQDVKLAAAGSRNASKSRIQEVVKTLYPGEIYPNVRVELEAVCDALAVWMAGREGDMVRSMRVTR